MCSEPVIGHPTAEGMRSACAQTLTPAPLRPKGGEQGCTAEHPLQSDLGATVRRRGITLSDGEAAAMAFKVGVMPLRGFSAGTLSDSRIELIACRDHVSDSPGRGCANRALTER